MGGIIQTGYGQTGYGYEEIGHWEEDTQEGVKAPIYNFSRALTLRDCNILSTNQDNASIYTGLNTILNLYNTYVEGEIIREAMTRIPPPR